MISTKAAQADKKIDARRSEKDSKKRYKARRTAGFKRAGGILGNRKEEKGED